MIEACYEVLWCTKVAMWQFQHITVADVAQKEHTSCGTGGRVLPLNNNGPKLCQPASLSLPAMSQESVRGQVLTYVH